jgi:hypothetical protein
MTTRPSEARAAPASPRVPQARSTLVYRVAALLSLALGSLSLVLYLFPTSGPVPESALTRVEGVPSDVEVTTRAKRYGSVESLRFRVGGYQTFVSGYHPKYEAVRAAVRAGGPVTAWLETKEKYRGDDRPLYQLAAGGRTVLSYDDTIREKAKERHSLLVGGIALMVMGVFIAGLGVVQSRRQGACITAIR